MTFDLALRLTEMLIGFALLQQSMEHVLGRKFDAIHSLRLLFGVLLMMGIYPSLSAPILLVLGSVLLLRHNGPYNGGSDRMSLLVLVCLCAVYLAPTSYWREVALGYLAVQLILSYLLSGAVKIVNPDWRDGTALRDVFLFSAYPVSEAMSQWADAPRLLFFMSWAVILFELVFPIAVLTETTLILGLSIAFAFHLANAYLFGLNRFVWAWLAAYPSILWLQGRIGTVG